MGCVSSKLFREEHHRDIIVKNGGRGGLTHVVSLTSTTYGALNLDINEKHTEKDELPRKEEEKNEAIEGKESPVRAEPEVINTWELMEDLEEEVQVPNRVVRKSPKSRNLILGFADLDVRTPLRFLNQFGSPRKAKTFGGKENKVRRNSDFSPRPVLKPKSVMKLSYPVKESPVRTKPEITGCENSGGGSSRRRSFSPLFDPELVALYEKELTSEEEQIKTIISLTPKTLKFKPLQTPESILTSYEEKCPPGGENSVVIYTTTLRGIRKTFEDCNVVRSIIESHHIHMIERDISMDSGLKEELRGLIGSKEVKVPLVFVKGRLIGGAEAVAKLDEEGKLGVLFRGIPRRVAGGCEGCAGIRFMMCVECNGSCKVLDVEEKKMVRCGDCNENGLIQCPICC
ncbi:Glutaredoxin family protein [Euphorbia peplus]|nr:Glutaredoxin family protein [Euphorbia peplus]